MEDLDRALDALGPAIRDWQQAYAGMTTPMHAKIVALSEAIQQYRLAIQWHNNPTPAEASPHSSPTTPRVGEQHPRDPSDPATYRQEFVRCGKSRCEKCVDGPSHGPYWYAYQRVNGRLIKKYVGKHRPNQHSTE